MTEGLFDGIFSRGGAAAEVADGAWLRALLEAEAALAHAHSEVGIIGAADAEAIAAACAPERFDAAALGTAAANGGNPVIPLVKQLTAAVAENNPEAARYVHYGATSQDIMDTAAMLVTRRACEAILGDAEAVSEEFSELAARHRDTPMAGRTLLQQALPTTFGVVAAGWLHGVGAAATRLREAAGRCCAAQLGGAAGTLASLGDKGPAVAAAYARQLGLAEPLLPWHAERGRVAELAGALGAVCGALAKPARDITLLAQTEVGEVSEAAGAGVGGSSTLAHKRNPIAAVSVLASTRQAPGLVAALLGAMEQEHQRAAGAWHSEWLPLRDLLSRTGSAAAWLRASAVRLRVDPVRMRANLDATGGALLAERVTADLTPELGRLAAHDLIQEACADASGRSLSEVLAERLDGRRSPADIDGLLAPEAYLGSAPEFVDRVLAEYRIREGN